MTSQADFTQYLATLDASLYQTPTPGFRGRMIALFCLTGLVIILSAIYLIVLGVENRRKKREWWFFKFVQRPSGRYIATNQAVWTGLAALISAVIILGHLQDEYRVYLYHASQSSTAAWRAWSWFPIVIHGWLISWASLQSFLLTPDQHNKGYLSASMANFLFVGGGVIIIVGLFVSSAFVTVSGNEVWHSYQALRATLVSLSSSPTLDFTKIILLTTQSQSLTIASSYFRRCTLALGILLAFTPFLTMIINIGSLGLARVLRKQIKQSLNAFQKSSTTTEVDRLAPSAVEKHGIYHPHQFKSSTSTLPSRSMIRQIASLQNQGFEGEQAKKIMLLQRAQTDLSVLGGLIFSLSLIFAGITIWVVTNLSTGAVYTLGWTGLEFALFSVEWVYSIVLSVALMFLIFNAYTHLSSKQSTTASEDVEAVYFGASNSIASFGAMFRKGDSPAGAKPTTFGNSNNTFGNKPAFPPSRVNHLQLDRETKRFSTVEEEEDEKLNFESLSGAGVGKE